MQPAAAGASPSYDGSSSVSIAKSDSYSQDEARAVIVTAVSDAFARVCGGGSAEAEAWAAAEAVGRATATAFASAYTFVDVQGEPRYSPCESCSTGRALPNHSRAQRRARDTWHLMPSLPVIPHGRHVPPFHCPRCACIPGSAPSVGSGPGPPAPPPWAPHASPRPLQSLSGPRTIPSTLATCPQLVEAC